MSVRGFGAPEVERAHAGAIELCRPGGNPEELFSALHTISFCQSQQGKLQAPLQLTERCLTVAQGQLPWSTRISSAGTGTVLPSR